MEYLSVFTFDDGSFAVVDTPEIRAALDEVCDGRPGNHLTLPLVNGTHARLRRSYIGGWAPSTPETREAQRAFNAKIHAEEEEDDRAKGRF